MAEDPCCFLCKTPSGVCATARKCDHHTAARLRFEAGRLTYRDPTGEKAVGNIMREQRKKRRRKGA